MTSVLKFSTLPLSCLIFTSEKCAIGGGHDFNPVIFGQNSSKYDIKYLSFKFMVLISSLHCR